MYILITQNNMLTSDDAGKTWLRTHKNEERLKRLLEVNKEAVVKRTNLKTAIHVIRTVFSLSNNISII